MNMVNVEDQIAGVAIQSFKEEQSLQTAPAEANPEAAAVSMPTQVNENNNNVPAEYPANVIDPMAGNSAAVGNL